jgi:pyruvate ferredoxin oxidoreductase alpha subunit
VRWKRMSEKKKKITFMTGTVAIANAVKLADVDVISAFPIRPYTGVMNELARMIADGEFDAEYIIAESEHGQFEIAKHAAATGARVFTGSAGIGLAYAHESVLITASNRVPVVAMVGNRAVDDPGNFGVEHNEVMCERDLGWMMCWPENPQEALDMTLMAYRICEDHRVYAPMFVCCDGYFVTHVRYPVEVPDPELVNKFLPPLKPLHRLHPDKPVTIACQVDYDWGFELRRQQDESMRQAKTVIEEVHAEFEKIFGKKSPPWIEEFMTEDADAVLIVMGSPNMPARVKIKELRKKGKKVGLIKLRRFRPFPTEVFQKVLPRFKVVGVVDNNFSFGSACYGGIVFQETRSALYELPKRPHVVDFIAGLGGREITPEHFEQMANIMLDVAKADKVKQDVYWIGLRE